MGFYLSSYVFRRETPYLTHARHTCMVCFVIRCLVLKILCWEICFLNKASVRETLETTQHGCFGPAGCAFRLETLYLTHARHAYMVRFLVQSPHLDTFASEPLLFFSTRVFTEPSSA